MSETPKSFGGAMDTRKVDFSAFTNDIPPSESPTLGANTSPLLGSPIETLSVTHPVGRGRTNTTLIQATIVQTDAASAYASFDYSANPSREPAVSVHFEPAAYGITETRDYVVSFYLDAFTPIVFDVEQEGAYNPAGLGSRTVNGQQVLSVELNVLPASALSYVYIQQTEGIAWSWYKTVIGPPPLSVIGDRQ